MVKAVQLRNPWGTDDSGKVKETECEPSKWQEKRCQLSSKDPRWQCKKIYRMLSVSDLKDFGATETMGQVQDPAMFCWVSLKHSRVLDLSHHLCLSDVGRVWGMENSCSPV